MPPPPPDIASDRTVAIATEAVTYDFERLMDNATLLKCSEFGHAIVKQMG